MQIITTWLKGSQNFAVGRIMYHTIGSDQAVKDLISRGETPFAKKLLAEAFAKMLVSGPEPAPANQETEVMQDSFDNILQALKEKWTEPYQRMNYLRHKLDKTFDDNDSIEAINYRKGIAFAILDLEQQCIQIWREHDYYVRTGKLPNIAETKMIIPTDPIKLANLISNITKNIRRNRKEMQKHADQPQYAQLYNEYKGRFQEVTGREYAEKN